MLRDVSVKEKAKSLRLKLTDKSSPSDWLCFQRKFNAIPLILVQIAILVLLLALILKRNDNETDEDVDHKEGNDNDVNDVVSGHDWPEVMHWSTIFLVGIDGNVQQARPTFKGRHCEQRQHCFGHIIEVETIVRPLTISYLRLVGVAIGKHQVRPVTIALGTFRAVTAFVELSLHVTIIKCRVCVCVCMSCAKWKIKLEH